MDRESLHKDGLLEQYLLGLTSREETQAIEKFLETDPQARADLEHLRGQLGVYLDKRGIDEKGDDIPPTGPDSVDDREVLAYLLERNQRLNIIRYLLLALCLLLGGTAVYFYRSSNIYQAELSSEKARHIQDGHRHKAALRELDRKTVHLDSMQTIVAPTEAGNLQLFYLPADSIVLIDLSHLESPKAGYAYHLHTKDEHAETPRYIVSAGTVHDLFPLKRHYAHLKVLYGPEHKSAETEGVVPVLVAELDLERVVAQKSQ